MRSGRLVGRVPEVVALDRLRAAAAGGHGAVVLLLGEAGIGKTAVVEEAVARASAAGSTVLTGRADPDEGAPAFWPWRRLFDRRVAGLSPEMFDGRVTHPSPDALGGRVPGLSPEGRVAGLSSEVVGGGVAGLSPDVLDARMNDGESPAAVRFRIVRTAVDALRAAGPLVLVLEDLHWADAASVALLRQLATDIADVPLLVIGTVRQPGEGFPLADFAGLPTVEIVTLTPLEPAAVATFLTQQADGPVHGSWAGVVHRLGGGNPLYIRELARLLARGDRLRGPASEVDLPDGLRRLVARRTAQLSDRARGLLGGAAALGAEVDVDVLRAAALGTQADVDAAALGGETAGAVPRAAALVPHGEVGAAARGAETEVDARRGAAPGAADVDRLLAEAVRAGLLVDDPWHPATLRFAHDVVRQVRYGELSRTERIGWHGRLADALEATGATSAEVARHRVRAAVDEGSRRTAKRSCADAALAAARGLDHAEAVRWYGRALEIAPGETDLLLARAEAAYRDGQLDVALADCAAVLDIAEADGRADVGAEAALVVRGVAGVRSPALIVLCERALALLGDADEATSSDGSAPAEGAVHARVLAQYAFLVADSGDVARAESISRRAMELAERSGRAEALVAAIHARHEVLDPVDHLDEMLELAGRTCALARDAGRPDAELWGRGWRLDALLMIGDLAGFDVELNRLTVLADRLGWPVARWHLLRARAARSLIAGRFAEAAAFAVEARDLGVRAQDESAPWLYLAMADGISAHTGDFRHWTGDLRAEAEHYFDVPIAAAQIGHVGMLSGDRELAAQVWARLRPVLPTLPANGRRMFIVLTAGELAVWLGDLDVARDCYARTQPYAGRYLNSTTACYGAVARPLGVIASALGAHDDADRLLARAVEMEERIGAAAFAAQARLAHARALIARGGPEDRRTARRLAEHAAATARRLGMPAVRAAAQRIAGDELTAREREIALLVADGLANRVIAEKLVLSERTVETHVRNVLAKLELGNRTQLAARLRTPPT
jgi:DNA-binding CsgD family transcriptional regulator